MAREENSEQLAEVIELRPRQREYIAGQLIDLGVTSMVELETLERQLTARRDDLDIELYIVQWTLLCRRDDPMPSPPSPLGQSDL